MVSTHEKEGDIQGADDVLQVKIRKITAADCKIYIGKSFGDIWAVYEGAFNITNRKNFHVRILGQKTLMVNFLMIKQLMLITRQPQPSQQLYRDHD
jgi:hypothetical protein